MKIFVVLICFVGLIECRLSVEEYFQKLIPKSENQFDILEKDSTLSQHLYEYYKGIFHQTNNNQKKTIDFKQQKRLQIFKSNLILVLKHNEDPSNSFQLKINEFSDWTDQERDQLRSNIDVIPSSSSSQPKRIVVRRDNDDHKIPSEFDWTNQTRVPNAVTPVKNQKHCGSCYAFAMVGALEKTYAEIYNRSGPLSPQQLVDCSNENNGCEGGSFLGSFHYIQSIGFRLNLEEDYPTTLDGKQNSQCLKSNGSLLSLNSTVQLRYEELPSEDETYMKKIVYERGPIYFSFNCGKREGNDSMLRFVSDKFDHYSVGIFDVPGCPTHRNMNHALVIVGYGNENGTDYWKVKNSWGADWGDHGYIKIKRNDNMCGIASYPYSAGLF